MSGKIYSPANTLASHNGNNSTGNPQVNNGDGLTVRYRFTPLSSPVVVERIKRAEAEAPREMPRGKRERVARYYSKVLSMALWAVYDGQPKNFPGRDYIEYVISALGYDQTDEWLYITDEDLILANMVSVRVRDDAALPREIERIGKQRVKLNEWQAKEGNPILIAHEAEYDQDAKKNRSKYQRPICDLLRDIIADCPVGTPDKRLRVTVVRKAAEYLERFAGSAKTTKRKREHSADSDANRAATFALGAFKKQENKSDAASAALLIRNAFMAKFGELYETVFGNIKNAENEKSDVASKGVNPESCGKTVGTVDGPKITELWCDKNIKPVPQSGENLTPLASPENASKPPLLGVSMEQFMAEFPAELDVEPGKKTSGKFTGHYFSLEEFERFDPKAGGYRKTERRFCCPDCGRDKPMDAAHRSLSLNTDTGAYHCHRCQASGVIRERWGDSSAARTFTYTGPKPFQRIENEADENWRKLDAKAELSRGTRGAEYLKGRGVLQAAQDAAQVRFGKWLDESGKPFDAVIFHITDRDGKFIAAQARSIEGKIMNTRGPKSQGVFLAAPDVLKAQRIFITEAPIDAMILNSCGFPSLALCGKSGPEWLSDALAGKDIAIAFDADEPGDVAAAALASLLVGRASTWRARPTGAKDFGEIVEQGGLDAVRQCVMEAMGVEV